MANCFFEDNDCIINVKPVVLINQDRFGWHTIIQIQQKDVLKLMKQGIIPVYNFEKDIFTLRVKVTTSTVFRINGVRIYDIDDKRLQKIPLNKVNIREIAVKKYSEKTKYYDTYYAKRLIFHLNVK